MNTDGVRLKFWSSCRRNVGTCGNKGWNLDPALAHVENHPTSSHVSLCLILKGLSPFVSRKMNQSQINNLVEKKHGPLNHQPDILAPTSGSNHPCQRILGCPKRNQKRDWKFEAPSHSLPCIYLRINKATSETYQPVLWLPIRTRLCWQWTSQHPIKSMATIPQFRSWWLWRCPGVWEMVWERWCVKDGGCQSCVWQSVWEMVCERWWCEKDGVWKMVVDKDVLWCVRDGVWKMVGVEVVCDKVCERWCVRDDGVWKMVCERWWLTKICDGVWEMVCDKVVLCGTGGRREDEEEEKDRDTESKTRTPQKKTWGNRSNKSNVLQAREKFAGGSGAWHGGGA